MIWLFYTASLRKETINRCLDKLGMAGAKQGRRGRFSLGAFEMTNHFSLLKTRRSG
jgi:hypothetical protein